VIVAAPASDPAVVPADCWRTSATCCRNAGANPRCCVKQFATGGAVAAPSGGSPLSDTVSIEAKDLDYVEPQITAPADRAFTLSFLNEDLNIQHNVEFRAGSAAGDVFWKGAVIVGPGRIVYEVPPLKAGDYFFACTVHPYMQGTVSIR
jgi:plastocyanin